MTNITMFCRYIATRCKRFIPLFLLLSVTTITANEDKSVYYRASNGDNYEIYRLDTSVDFLHKVVEKKIEVWTSLLRCDPTSRIKFVDPLFSNDWISLQVKNDCSLSVVTQFYEQKCSNDSSAIMIMLDNYKSQLNTGYGVEYITPQDQYYINNFCK